MQTHHASTPNAANAASLAVPVSPNPSASQPVSGYSALTAERKRTVADLVDDQEALAEWQRNVARLRAEFTY